MWKCVLELNEERTVAAGSATALSSAIRSGADLRIYTEFRYNEHIDVYSDNPELVQEVAEFGITYLLQDNWVAGVMSLRQPISPPESFGPRPSMSFFLYNQDGGQAIARPYLDGAAPTAPVEPARLGVAEDMPRYFTRDNWDEGTNAPSSNFIYDFDRYRFFVNDSWREVFSHNAEGEVLCGSLDSLTKAFEAGAEVKVAIRNLCSRIGRNIETIDHEVFVKAGSCYYNTERRIFTAGTHPLVRVRPAVPLRYESQGWDFGWLMARSDGYVEYRRCDPYSLAFEDRKGRYALRWFVRD